MKRHFSLLAAIIVFQLLPAQEILLTIDDHQITKDEFLRIYNKNSAITAEDKKSIDEYLDLFINYKLKVVEAEDLGYDTISSFIKEMAGYTTQLAKPYLDNNQLIDSLVEEAYQRSFEEVNVSHILLQLEKNALPKDTAKVYNRIMAIRNRILVDGESWDKVILDESPDPDSPIGGDLGWFTVFRMVYPFESAAYNTPVGEISMPIRTEYGYHLIKVNGRRKNRGEVFTAHILTTTPQNPSNLEIEAAKNKIEKAYAELQNGVPWDSVVVKYSEHRATVNRGGRIGWLRSTNAPEELLDACFSIDSGQYSQPIQTTYGFHIVRPEKYKGVPLYMKGDENFKKKVIQNSYVRNMTENQVVNRIKNEYGFKFYQQNLEELYNVVDSSLYAGNWNPEVAKGMLKPVFSIGDSIYSQYDIARHIASVRHSKRTALINSVYSEVIKFTNKQIMDYEITQLPKKYSDYRYLLEEYHDGILLFNLTEDMVWRKAVEDSIGLQKFYNELPEKYQWESRVLMTKYSYKDSTLTAKLIKVAKSRNKKGLTAQDISKLICPQDTLPCVNFVELKYEKGDNAIADSIPWKTKANLVSRDKNNIILYFVDAILPPQSKVLNDARGLYTADYQTYLEQLWIEDLRAKHSIEINEEVFNEIKKEEESDSGN